MFIATERLGLNIPLKEPPGRFVSPPVATPSRDPVASSLFAGLRVGCFGFGTQILFNWGLTVTRDYD